MRQVFEIVSIKDLQVGDIIAPTLSPASEPALSMVTGLKPKGKLDGDKEWHLDIHFISWQGITSKSDTHTSYNIIRKIVEPMDGKPEFGTGYWFLTDIGRPKRAIWGERIEDLSRLRWGNCFLSEDEALHKACRIEDFLAGRKQ